MPVALPATHPRADLYRRSAYYVKLLARADRVID